MFASMARSLKNLKLDGGCIVFNFINTVNSRIQTSEFDYLKDYSDLLAWAEKAELLDKKRLKLISVCLEGDEGKGKRVFKKTIKIRELLYAFFSVIAQGGTPDVAMEESFNVALGQAFSMIRITINSGASKVTFTDRNVSLEEPLWIILISAYKILTEVDYGRIRACPGCGWLFLDTSKNGKRRWCNMQVCGSHDKALRYYHRNKTNSNPNN
ncbi:MAG: CGNR zinc finger domain-containing protein [Cyclobacteriaceae bacterium]|nr:CGNR zinc finger domain-containing protein [Cyclobacteriaceae bacterium]